MTEDYDAKDSQADSGSKTFLNKNKDKKAKTPRPLTKIIVRRLPPTMSEEDFLDQVSPIPEHDYFYFAKPDVSLGNNVYSRAYINFVNVEDIYLFRDKFDGYIFLDDKGVEYVGIVEYAPFQRIPKKKKKKDPKCGTIESDPIFQEFIEGLSKEVENENLPKLEYSYPVSDGTEKKVQTTPLLEFLAARKLEKRSRDERRRREHDKRKLRVDRKTKEVSIKEEEGTESDVKKIKSREWEKEKSSDSKEDSTRDGTIYESKTFREQRKVTTNDKKKYDKKEDDQDDESDKGTKKEKRDKFKESPREVKSKKYSDTRKERTKQTESSKLDKQSVIGKIISSDSKTKSLNHDDIKPFTQLPQVKTDDLTKIIEGMDKKTKLDDFNIKSQKSSKDSNDNVTESKIDLSKARRNSLESSEFQEKEEFDYISHKGLDERCKSTDREGSEEKEKGESTDLRNERRIRNKDRPSLVIYQPGMGKFSKQRLAKEKDTTTSAKSVNESEKRDT